MFHLAALSALRCRKRSRAERIAASSFFWPASGASVSTAFFSLTYLSSSGMLCQIRSRIHSPAAQAPPRLEHTQCSSGHVTTQAKTHRYTLTQKERERQKHTHTAWRPSPRISFSGPPLFPSARRQRHQHPPPPPTPPHQRRLPLLPPPQPRHPHPLHARPLHPARHPVSASLVSLQSRS